MDPAWFVYKSVVIVVGTLLVLALLAGSSATTLAFASSGSSLKAAPATPMVKTIKVGYNSEDIISDSTGKFLYVLNFNSISVINASSDKVVKTVKLESGSCCNYKYQGIYETLDPRDNSLYIMEHRVGIEAGHDIVSVVNSSSLNVVARIPIGYGGGCVGYNPVTNLVYVPNAYNDTVMIINTTTNSVQKTVSVGPEPVCLAFSTSGNTYISNFGGATVSVISTTFKVKSISLDGYLLGPFNMVFDPSNNELYVADRYTIGQVSVIDTSTNKLLTTIGLDDCYYPLAIGYNPTYKMVYVGSSLGTNSDTVTVINATSNSVLGVVTEGAYPWSFSYNPVTHRTYVMNMFSDTVGEFSGIYLEKIVSVAQYPLFAIFDILNEDMYVLSQGTSYGTVTVLT